MTIRKSTIEKYIPAIKEMYEALTEKPRKVSFLYEICARHKICRATPSYMKRENIISVKRKTARWENYRMLNFEDIATKIIIGQRFTTRYIEDDYSVRPITNQKKRLAKEPMTADCKKDVDDATLINMCKQRGWKVLIPKFEEA